MLEVRVFSIVYNSDYAWLQSRGVICRISVKNRKNKNWNTIYRLFIRNRDSIKLWLDRVLNISDEKKVVYRDIDRPWRSSTVDGQLSIVQINDGGYGDVYDIHVNDVHEYLADGLVTHNSGKSYASIAICKTLDPNFSVDQIYFNYNDLVYNKNKLKPGMAVLVDEQSDAYGIDSNRVNIILTALKEQLRKKSIHFIFCSPTLKPEHETSMYILETMFLDFETQECYAAKRRNPHFVW